MLSAALPHHSEAQDAYECEPVICTLGTAQALAQAAEKVGRRLSIHLKVDTGMGRIGIHPREVSAFLERCRDFPPLRVQGLMSQFPRADEADQTYSLEQLARFRQIIEATRAMGSQCATWRTVPRSLTSLVPTLMPCGQE